jgi:CheY-like chemotaxis protein
MKNRFTSAACTAFAPPASETEALTGMAGVDEITKVGLRRARTAPVARSDEALAQSKVNGAMPVGRRGRILMVEDDAMVARTLERILATDHDVLLVVAAAEVLALCAKGDQFDLILCDLMMPEMTGMELHRLLSLRWPAQAERMMFLTGGAFTPQARQFLARPLIRHLEKPFDTGILRAIVQRHLLGPMNKSPDASTEPG